jgi:penicillin-binding protein 1A
LALLRRNARAPKRRRIRKLRLLALLVVLSLLGLSAFTFGLLTAIAAQIPDLDPARQAQRQEKNTYLYASNGRTILAILRGSQARVVVDSEDISPWLKHAIVAVEDRRFYEHRGVDVRGILRAVKADITNRGAVQGGSTITQQFVKNAINQDEQTISRKLREAALAWRLERKWSKDRILTSYLNTVYFGNGAYGVEQASRIYFQHGADSVTRAEAALLAGIPGEPSLYDPVAHPRIAKARRDLVLKLMRQQGYITRAQYVEGINAAMPDPEKVRLPATQTQWAPYFANYVTDQLVEKFHTRGVYGGGLHVKTTIDLKMQKMAQEAIAKALPPDIGPTAALVTIDAHTGAVLAMVGGRSYRKSQFNLATQGERQPGSSFKPFVLAAALRSGISPATTFVSRPVTIDAGGRLWQVNNYESAYNGTIDLRSAIAYSDNSVFAQLTNVVGPKNVAATAKELGIGTPLNGYFSIGLGAEAATPLDMARAYAAFANGGYRADGALLGNKPRVVDCLMDDEGNCKRSNSAINQRVLEPEDAATIDDLLQGVVTYGTGKAARISGYAVAGKTGTTENYGDAWFVGYTPDLVTAVWVGYPDELRPMLTEYRGRAVAGGTYPALIWKAFMETALPYRVENATSRSFPQPSYRSATPQSVVRRDQQLQLDNGNCSNATTVQLFATTELAVASCDAS